MVQIARQPFLTTANLSDSRESSQWLLQHAGEHDSIVAQLNLGTPIGINGTDTTVGLTGINVVAGSGITVSATANASGDKTNLTITNSNIYPRAGTVNIADNNVTGTVTLTPNEPDVNYVVVAAPGVVTGAVASGTFHIVAITKLVGSFAVNINTAPGVGNDITYNWMLAR